MVWAFIYIDTLYIRTATGLSSLCICAGWPDPSLLDNVIKIENNCCGYLYIQ